MNQKRSFFLFSLSVFLLLSMLFSCEGDDGIKTLDLGNGVSLKLIKVKAGRFQMGSPKDELGRFDDENQHWVTLTKDYWLGETEVTQGQWKAVMWYNPSRCKNGDDYPVEMVSNGDAVTFCEQLNKRYRGQLPKGYQFSLPTEAQWEYACRAGTTSSLNSGKNITLEKGSCPNLDEVGWYRENTERSHCPVRQKRPNAWGFYDMHGNVQEWCSDRAGDYSGDTTDPKGASNSFRWVYRGGSWRDNARYCRAANRSGKYSSDRSHDYLGFRLALVPVQ